jgi:hypothetical protein
MWISMLGVQQVATTVELKIQKGKCLGITETQQQMTDWEKPNATTWKSLPNIIRG